MKKSELTQILKPLIKECIKEILFEDGILSSLITEVAQGLGNITSIQAPVASKQQTPIRKSESIIEAKKQLNEVKAGLQKATGLQGIFEGTSPIPSRSNSESSKYGALKDKDPGDAGVNIDGLIKMTGGWEHLK
jgi:hypothetical protein